MKGLSEKAKLGRRLYYKEWRRKNKEKILKKETELWEKYFDNHNKNQS
jgi:hypothetical protein